MCYYCRTYIAIFVQIDYSWINSGKLWKHQTQTFGVLVCACVSVCLCVCVSVWSTCVYMGETILFLDSTSKETWNGPFWLATRWLAEKMKLLIAGYLLCCICFHSCTFDCQYPSHRVHSVYIIIWACSLVYIVHSLIYRRVRRPFAKHKGGQYISKWSCILFFRVFPCCGFWECIRCQISTKWYISTICLKWPINVDGIWSIFGPISDFLQRP